MNYCYKAEFDEFIVSDEIIWLDSMKASFAANFNQNASGEQIGAWSDCYKKIKNVLKDIKGIKAHLIFEYELPREGGRRPDLVVLINTTILVIEFKKKNFYNWADLDQVKAYARDLGNYHEQSHSLKVVPILVPTLTKNLSIKIDKTMIISPDKLEKVFRDFVKVELTINAQTWTDSDYEPLPTLVQAARFIFKNEHLPNIRRANSAGIPEAVSYLNKLSEHAATNKGRHLALVTGVPGAGKTLLGLKFVHENKQMTDGKKDSVFLSGNGPLVDVLQHALDSKVFVQPLKNYILTYGIKQSRAPKEHIVVFDEAQRAWDREKVLEKHNHDASEPDLILQIAGRIEPWSMFVGLIGEGQEIHSGEESGMLQWVDAIKKSKNKWTVHCPKKLVHLFDKVATVETVDNLDLTVSLRSHISENVTRWVELFLNSKFEMVKQMTPTLFAQGFDVYVTRNLEQAKQYCKDRYQYCLDKRYGMIATSKSRKLPSFGVDNSFQGSKFLKIGPWFNEPVDSDLSCCSFNKVATEFSCQGLELDFPVVCWDTDLKWDGTKWEEFIQPRAKTIVKDAHQLRLNSYRVLLTRGRDGFVIFIPPVPELDKTYELLKSLGLRTAFGMESEKIS
ncbi:MAG: DNA/RNA helicase domain-containing protein [bacterium]